MDARDKLLYELIGRQIRAARERAKPTMSQAKLAEKVGLTRASVVNIEAGRQHAPVHVLWRIAEELGVELVTVLPRTRDLEEEVQPVPLSEEVAALIEKHADGNAKTRRQLISFVTSYSPVEKRRDENN